LEEISIIFGDPVGLTDVEHPALEDIKMQDKTERVEVASFEESREP
jgi:hypothetical protein